MSVTDDTALVRVERGAAREEELAALTALLVARATAARGPGAGPGRPARPVPRWSRRDRYPSYRSPLSWQAGV